MMGMEVMAAVVAVVVAVVVVDTNWERNVDQLLDDYQHLIIF